MFEGISLTTDLPCPECHASAGRPCQDSHGHPAPCCAGRLRAWSESRPPLEIQPGPGPEAVIPVPDYLAIDSEVSR